MRASLERRRTNSSPYTQLRPYLGEIACLRARNCLGATMKRTLIIIAICTLVAVIAKAQNVKVNPTGVNVNPNTGTTVFLTFGPVNSALRPAEATWCGELIPAAPDLGLKCDPATIFGSLPAR